MYITQVYVATPLLLILFCSSCLPSITAERQVNESTDSNAGKRNYKIAIVGGGVGGTSAAYFLNELLDKKATHNDMNYEIDIFEQSNKIGGRVATIQFEDKEYEAGGSIIHERNRYASQLLQKFGLKKKKTIKTQEKTCIYNGREYVFCDDSWQFLTYISLWFRYGFDPLRMQSRVSKVLDQFERIYKIQENEQAFEQVSELLSAMNPSLVNLTLKHYNDLLEQEYGFSHTFVQEIVQAVTLVNYGQTVSIPAFVGLVSFAGSGSELWSVSGGNKQIPIHLARNSNAQILLNTKVDSITYLGDHKYQVDSINLDKQLDELKSQSAIYDYVILAAPMTSGSDIRFANFTRRDDLLTSIFDKYQMHQTVATFVKGHTLQSYTGKAILSCDIDNGGSFFTSFSPLTPVTLTEADIEQDAKHELKSTVYKIFSNSQLKSHDLYTFFEDIEEVREVIWHAYPEYNRVNRPFPPFKIRAGMYYINAIEWAASAIEMSLIGGKNVALLVCQDLDLCQATDKWSDGLPNKRQKTQEL